MASDTFTGTGTLNAHDSNWKGEADTGQAILDGSGHAESADGATKYVAYTGSSGNYSRITLPGLATPPATDYRSPMVWSQIVNLGDTTNAAYAIRKTTLSGNNYTQINLSAGGTFLHAFTGLSIDGTASHVISINVASDGGTGNNIEVLVNDASIGTYNETTASYTSGLSGIAIAGGGTVANSLVDDWTDTQPSGNVAFSGIAIAEQKTTQNQSSGIIAGPFHISEYLRASPANGGALRTNLSGLHVTWFDADPATGAAATDTSITATTDSNGLLYFALSNSTLVSGQTGYLVLSDPTTGWYVTAPLTVKNYFEA